MTTPPLSRRLGALLAAACAILAFAITPAASAATFGYGDNRPDLFTDTRWQALPLKDVRRTVDWDTQTKADKTVELDTWMKAAQSAGARPLIAIDRSWSPGQGNKKPTVAQYTSLIKWLKARYPWWSRLTPWNEANHIQQPTVRDPKLAFQYWQAAKKACTGCIVTSPALLANGEGVSSKFIPAFLKLAKGKVKLWAIHVYGDQNRLKDTGLKQLEKQLKGTLWVTETAAWVKFGDSPKWSYNEDRANKVLKFIFTTAKKHPRVKYWFLWQWEGEANPKTARWDSGVLNADGTERKHYATLVAGVKG